jgi:hypothetical protein
MSACNDEPRTYIVAELAVWQQPGIMMRAPYLQPEDHLYTRLLKPALLPRHPRHRPSLLIMIKVYTRMLQQMSHPGQLTFFDLPRELRDMIHHHVFGEPAWRSTCCRPCCSTSRFAPHARLVHTWAF